MVVFIPNVLEVVESQVLVGAVLFRQTGHARSFTAVRAKRTVLRFILQVDNLFFIFALHDATVILHYADLILEIVHVTSVLLR